MRAARFVGRVGGLAVALGVGVAVSLGAPAAWADDSGSASSEESTGTAGAGETGATTGSQDTSATPGPPGEPDGGRAVITTVANSTTRVAVLRVV